MALEYPQPTLTDGVVLLRPWDERDLPTLEQASRDDHAGEPEERCGVDAGRGRRPTPEQPSCHAVG